MRKFLLAAASVLALSTAALADSGQAVNQAANRNDMATFLVGPAATAACTAVNATAAQGTITITPPAGFYVVITSVEFDFFTDATGVTAVENVLSAGLATLPGQAAASWTDQMILAGANNIPQQYSASQSFPTGLRSNAPGGVVSFTPSSQQAHGGVCGKVAGYFMQQSQ